MVKMMRRRLGYRKTRRVGSSLRSTSYSRGYSRSYPKRYGTYNRYKSNYSYGSYKPRYRRYTGYGRQRISLFKKTKRIQKISKVINVEVAKVFDENTMFSIYNGKYLRPTEFVDVVHPIYVELLRQVPTNVFDPVYELSLEQTMTKPTLMLENSILEFGKDGVAGAAVCAFYPPIVSHYLFARDLQQFLQFPRFEDNYVDAATIVVVANDNSIETIRTGKELADDAKTVLKEYIRSKIDFVDHYCSTLVGLDVLGGGHIKHVVIFKNNRIDSHIVLPAYSMTPNIRELKNIILTQLLIKLAYPSNSIEAQVANNMDKFTNAWTNAFNSIHKTEYKGIFSGCIALTDKQKISFSRFLSEFSLYSVVHGASTWTVMLKEHKTGSLPEGLNTAINVLASLKLFTIRHLKSSNNEDTSYYYAPARQPNILLIAAYDGTINGRIKQKYRLISGSSMKQLRLAIYNNPSLYAMLTDTMKSYVDRAYPEIRLYKEGVKDNDRKNRKNGFGQ